MSRFSFFRLRPNQMENPYFVGSPIWEAGRLAGEIGILKGPEIEGEPFGTKNKT